MTLASTDNHSRLLDPGYLVQSFVSVALQNGRRRSKPLAKLHLPTNQ